MASATVNDVVKWSIFCLGNSELMSQVKFAIVFGTSGNEALFVTKSDEVYGIGTNCSGCLGLGNFLLFFIAFYYVLRFEVFCFSERFL